MALSQTVLSWADADSGELITLVFDCVTSLSPEDAVDVTDHPVEEGFDVTDGARSKATMLSVEAFVSEVPNAELDDDVAFVSQDAQVPVVVRDGMKKIPINPPSPPLNISESGLLQAAVGGLVSLLVGGPGPATVAADPSVAAVQQTFTTIAQDSPRNRVRDVYDKLLKLKDDHTTITVNTRHRDYFDMMVTRVGAPRTQSEGTGSKFQVDFKQIRTVTSQTVAAPKPAEPRGTAQKNNGAQSGKPDPNGEKKRSAALQLGDFFGKLFGG